ncbi:hypothetical protein [Chondromyces crocatus]|uniref:Uncharacterized protein n=1 Tax=Chondromyces crocatus TaxID=52 RepID=A0A0K1EPM5_CHOCO|nr:hypothetical protein [Chondromyces crocatus]AKT42811.1 uncharacterized protein CMC5_070380 [Chondromyces crocatus]
MKPVRGADSLAALAVMVLIGGAVASRPLMRVMAERPTSEECLTLLDRYVELVAHAVDATPSRFAAIVTERRAAASAVVSEQGFPRCQSELTREEVTCGLRANSADDLERCLP